MKGGRAGRFFFSVHRPTGHPLTHFWHFCDLIGLVLRSQLSWLSQLETPDCTRNQTGEPLWTTASTAPDRRRTRTASPKKLSVALQRTTTHHTPTVIWVTNPMRGIVRADGECPDLAAPGRPVRPVEIRPVVEIPSGREQPSAREFCITSEDVREPCEA